MIIIVMTIMITIRNIFFFLLHHSYYKLVLYSVGSPGCVLPP